MSGPTIDLIDSTALPRPECEAWYEPGLISDYYEARRPYHILRRKGSVSSYLIYSLSSGGFIRDRHDRALLLKAGDLALIQANTYQEYGLAPGASLWRCHWVHFDVQPDWTHWIPLSQDPGLEGVSYAHVRSRSRREQVNNLLFEIHTESKRPEVWSAALRLNLLERVLILARCGSGEAGSRPEDPRIWKVLQLIEARSPEVPSQTELSAAAGLSPSRLASVFKQQTGVSIMGAVNRLRLRSAKYALLDRSASMIDVAERSGFKNPYSFSNWFLKQTGQRPASYRRKWRRDVACDKEKASRAAAASRDSSMEASHPPKSAPNGREVRRADSR